MVQFGIVLGWIYHNEGIDRFEILSEIAQECERKGFDSIWLNDHFFADPPSRKPWFECWTTMSALSAKTNTIRIGPLCACNSYRYPSVLAKMAATFDVISNGRLELCIGAGWRKEEYEAYGVPFPLPGIRIEQLREGLQILKKMWTEDEPTFEGEYYRIEEAFCDPKPLQKPHPPIWIGGEKSRLVRTAAEFADGYNYWGTPQEYLQKLKVLRKHCVSLGRNIEEIQKSYHGAAITADSMTDIRKKVQRFSLGHPERERIMRQGIIGTPDECVKKLQEYIDIGITYFILYLPDITEPQTLDFFAKEVVTKFRK